MIEPLGEFHGPTALAIHNAVEHTLQYWSRLTRFLDHTRMPTDNNATATCFRGPGFGHKNYDGATSHRGTAAA